MRFALALCALFALSHEPQKDPQRANGKGDAATDKRGTPEAPAVVQVLPAPKTQAQADTEARAQADHASNESKTANATLALAIITGALTAGTLVLAGFTFALWRSTNRLATEAKGSADATLAHLQESSERQLRAYVTLREGEIVDQGTVSAGKFLSYKMMPVIRNCGQTPARNVRYFACVCALPKFLAADFDFTLDPVYLRAVGVLGPQDERTIHVWADDYFPPEVLGAPGVGDNRLWFYGTILYVDVFGVDRTTNFCFWINRGGGKTPHIWTRWIHHNEAD